MPKSSEYLIRNFQREVEAIKSAIKTAESVINGPYEGSEPTKTEGKVTGQEKLAHGAARYYLNL